MSNKMWDILVEHAKTCVLSGKLYVYYPEDARNVGVVFNHIYELSGLITNGQYFSADYLSESQKVRRPAELILNFCCVCMCVFFIDGMNSLALMQRNVNLVVGFSCNLWKRKVKMHMVTVLYYM